MPYNTSNTNILVNVTLGGDVSGSLENMKVVSVENNSVMLEKTLSLSKPIDTENFNVLKVDILEKSSIDIENLKSLDYKNTNQVNIDIQNLKSNVISKELTTNINVENLKNINSAIFSEFITNIEYKIYYTPPPEVVTEPRIKYKSMINYKCLFVTKWCSDPKKNSYIDTKPCYFYYYSLFQEEGIKSIAIVLCGTWTNRF